MIDKIELENFQAHPSTVLELDPGVNAIVGSSDSGKSTILRALGWVFNNRPSGTEFVSFWNREAVKKKTDPVVPVNPTRVSITIKDTILTRERTKANNRYIVRSPKYDEPKVLNAVRTDVPIEVEEILNISDVNLQLSQYEPPFLFSAGGGEVARFLNRTIKIELLDKMQSIAESLRRKTATERENALHAMNRMKEREASMEWTDKAAQIVERARRIGDRLIEWREEQAKLEKQSRQFIAANAAIAQAEKVLAAEDVLTTIASRKSRIEGMLAERRALSAQRQDFLRYECTVADAEKVLPAASIIAEIEKRKREVVRTREEVCAMQASVEGYRSSTEAIKRASQLLQAEGVLLRIAKRKEVIISLKKESASLSQSIETYNSCMRSIARLAAEIESYESELPDVCPLCGEERSSQK